MGVMPTSSLSLAEALFVKFAKSFYDTTGLPVQLRRPGEFQVGEEDGMPDFCRVMARGRKSCEQCEKFHLSLQDAEGGQARTQRCFAGLTSSAVPVVREGQAVGFLHTGHAYVDRMPGCGNPGQGCALPGRREGGYPCAGACRKTARLPAGRYEGVLGLLAVFSEQLASLSLQPVAGAGYPAVDHVIRQIRHDPTRPWRLTECARMAGMHPAYFSEKFHQRTGSTLTAYLAGQRVEKARQLLSYTGLPVSEIGFASGFRSLSQFNRVYKKLVGRPPGADRRKREATRA